MIVGEIANFAAYAFAPAILVTPLGALSIIIRHDIMWDILTTYDTLFWFWSMWVCCSAVLAHIILREKLHIFGVLGCALCVVGSTTIVLHAPQEREIESVKEVWDLATEPGDLALLILFRYLLLIFTFYLLSLTTASPCSFSLLCNSGDSNCCYSNIPLYPTIWSNSYNVLHWCLLAIWFIIGRLCYFL